jgi:hypothetical protein
MESLIAAERPWPRSVPRVRYSRVPSNGRDGIAGPRPHIGIMRIFTIGYEGATQTELIEALVSAGVTLVADVRAVPLSPVQVSPKMCSPQSSGNPG